MAGKALKGDPIATFGKLKKRLRELPLSLAHDVAQASAPGLTARTRQAYASGQTVYGDARPAGVDGGALDLKRTGDTERTLHFVANGRIVRCVLGTRYAKYLISRYGILPLAGRMPPEWSRYLAELVKRAQAEKYLRV